MGPYACRQKALQSSEHTVAAFPIERASVVQVRCQMPMSQIVCQRLLEQWRAGQISALFASSKFWKMVGSGYDSAQAQTWSEYLGKACTKDNQALIIGGLER